MALGKQNLFVPLGAALDRGIDPHLIPVGKSSVVFNGYYNHVGELVKRPGSTIMNLGLTPGSGTIGSTWQLATYKGALVNLEQAPTTHPIEVLSPSAGQFSTVIPPGATGTSALVSGRRGPVATGLIPIASDVNTNIPGDIAVSSGYVFVAHTSAASATTFYVLDATTNQIVYRWRVAVLATQPRIVVINNYVGLFYFATASNRIMADVWQIVALDTGTGAPTTSNVSAADALGIFDVTQGSSTQAAVAYRQNANQLWRVDFTMSTGATASVQITTAAAAAINPSLDVAWITDLAGAGKLAVATAGPAGLQTQWNLTGGTPATTYVLDAGATANIAHITGHTISNVASGEFQVLYEDRTATADSQIKIGQRTVASGISAGLWIRSVGLTSRTFANAGSVYVLVNYNYAQSAPTLQPTYFLMQVTTDALTNPNPIPQARLAPRSAVLASSSSNLPSVALSGSLFMTPVAISTPTIATLAQAVNVATIQFNPAIGRPCDTSLGLIVPGGTSTIFDGVNFGSFDFDIYPETPVPISSTAGVGLTANGTYTYQIVYARTDAMGNVYRSAPSPATSITMGPGPGNLAVLLPLVNLRLTNVPTKIEIYRTLANQSTPLQLVATVDNNPNALTQNFTDTLPDANLAANAPLYTTGGVLPNESTPGFSSIITVNGRVFAISMENPNEVWFSNVLVAGQGPSFNEDFIITIADENGGNTGLAAIDDKIVVFKSNVVYAFNGDGPDNLNRGAFNTPQIIARGVGSLNPQSILSLPDGAAFMSTATGHGSLELIDRSLSLRIREDGTSFGSPVKDDVDAFPIVAATLIPELSQARWYLNNRIVLVYDIIRAQWTEFFYSTPAINVQHACAYSGGGVWAGVTPALTRDNPITGPFLDGSSTYFFTAVTPWVQLAGVSGYQRLWKIQGVGTTVGSHLLTVQVFGDFDLSSPIGTYTGTPGALWDWELIPKRQLCRAVQIRVSDFSSTTAGPTIAGVTLQLGVVPGLNRLGAGKRLRA